MIEKKIVICLQHGLQARLATKFVQKASSFNSEVNIIKNGKSVAGKSIMGVMALAIREGEEITLIANGRDEQQAVVVLEEFLLNKE
ncbi:HPr family phosphocarrier protein [Ectobacillus funiculus]|uniref:HPr family phosphocarrier protein n=1 Tax=Ectobacillus funiculus TaxID=137993 RepID=UPI00397C5F70